MQLCVTLLAAGCAWAAYKQAFVSSRMKKRMNELEIAHTDLESSFQSLLESHGRLRSRAGMREIRAKDAKPETKEEARARIFGNATGPAFAKKQLAAE
jgi:hypothetical protein